MRRVAFLLALATTAMTLCGAPASTAGFKSSFAKPPAAAVKELGTRQGTANRNGYVFVDGRYIAPPYTVSRYGTVLRINGIQICPEVVPWDEFIKTQSGVTKQETTTGEVAAAPEPEPEPEPDFDDSDDSDTSLDDLFDDDPAPKKPASKPKRKASRPKPPKPTVKVSYSFDGDFELNDKSKALLEKINAARTRVDKHLRSGGYYFFGSGYSVVSGDAGAARHLMEKLPELMRDRTTRDAFVSGAFSAGLVNLPRPLLLELFRNRFSYPELLSRRKTQQTGGR